MAVELLGSATYSIKLCERGTGEFEEKDAVKLS